MPGGTAATSLVVNGQEKSQSLQITTSYVPVTINGGSGDDTFTLANLNNESGPEAVVRGGGGNDILNVNANAGEDVDIESAAALPLDANETFAQVNIGPDGGIILEEGDQIVLRTASLSVDTDEETGTPAGFIDLNDNEMIVDYTTGSSPITAIQDLLKSGYNAGAWTGNGIRSTTAAAVAGSPNVADKRAIGVAEASEVFSTFPATFASQDVDNSTVLLRFTYYGDATVDGTVNLLDFNKLSANYNASGKRWGTADFNFDGNCNQLDFNALAGNYRNQTGLGGGGEGGGGGQGMNAFNGDGEDGDPYYTYDELWAMLGEATGGW